MINNVLANFAVSEHKNLFARNKNVTNLFVCAQQKKE